MNRKVLTNSIRPQLMIDVTNWSHAAKMLGRLLKNPADIVLVALRGSTTGRSTIRLLTRCGLAWDKARLSAPELGGGEVWTFEQPAGHELIEPMA